MAYCVACGVKLQEEMLTCPLCHTPAIDPKTLTKRSVVKDTNVLTDFDSSLEFSDLLVQPVTHRLSHRAAAVSSLLLLIPVFILLAIDIIINVALTWSFYPIISLIYVWSAFLFPFLFKSRKRLEFALNVGASTIVFMLLIDGYAPPVTWAWFPILSLASLTLLTLTAIFLTKRHKFPAILIFTATIALFLMAIALLTQGSWYLPLALPLVLLTGALSLGLNGTFWLVGRGRTSGAGFGRAAFSGIFLAVYCLGIDLICTLYLPDRTHLGWSFVCIAILLPLSAFLLVAHGNSRLRSYMEKKFHI